MTRVSSYLHLYPYFVNASNPLVRYSVFTVNAHSHLSLRDKYQNLEHWRICFRFGVTITCVKTMDKKKSEI